jgi:hypothetical protein
MDLPYREINLPSLVKDVQVIFWEHIDPHGLPPHPTRPLRAFRVSATDSKHQAIRDIMVKYPFLDDHLLLFKLAAKTSTGIHLDGLGDKVERNFSCNIPVSGCTVNSLTEFFQIDTNNLFYDKVNMTRFLKPNSPASKIYEYSMIDNPVLCNTQIPHRVNNTQGSETRVSVSWTVRYNWTWDKIADYIAKNY